MSRLRIFHESAPDAPLLATSDRAGMATELAAIGVPVPDSFPTFYELDSPLLTTAASLPITAATTSGEVEPVLIRHGGVLYLGVGSDHTDRRMEQTDISLSKAACPKPIAPEVLPLESVLARCGWDDIQVSCTVDGTPYQDGLLARLRDPDDLLDRMAADVGSVEQDFVLFMGTIPLLGTSFTYGTIWDVRLHLPGGDDISHSYVVRQAAR